MAASLQPSFYGSGSGKAMAASLPPSFYGSSSGKTMAASLPPSFYGFGRLTPRSKVRLAVRTRAQSSANEGNSSISIVDANMGVLKERMEKLRTQERLRRWCKDGEGWYYQKQYDRSLKRSAKLSETLEVAELIAGTFGLTILSCTFCLCLVSLMAHLGR